MVVRGTALSQRDTIAYNCEDDNRGLGGPETSMSLLSSRLETEGLIVTKGVVLVFSQPSKASGSSPEEEATRTWPSEW